MDDNKKSGMAVMIGMGGEGMEGGYEKVSFMAPEGMDVSEMKEGDEKEILAMIRYDGEGQFTLVSVDGYPLAESGDEEMPEGYEEGEENEMEEEESYPQRLQSRAGLA
jgi:hypothetical protein